MAIGRNRVTKAAVAALVPRLPQLAPTLTRAFIAEVLDRAIDGLGPLPAAAETAEHLLAKHAGNSERGVHDVIERHVRYAAIQGFATNLGGLVTMAVTVPANITGMALLQSRMVAGLVHLRGYDLQDERVRNAVLATLLGEDRVRAMVRAGSLAGTPYELATDTIHSTVLDEQLSADLAAELMNRIAGKRVASVVARRTPLVGGVVGAGSDGFTTWRVGRYADREFLPVTRR